MCMFIQRKKIKEPWTHTSHLRAYNLSTARDNPTARDVWFQGRHRTHIKKKDIPILPPQDLRLNILSTSLGRGKNKDIQWLWTQKGIVSKMANTEIKQGNKIIHNKTKTEKRTLFFYRHSCSELHKSSSKPSASLLPDVTTESELKVFVAQSCPTLCDPMDCSPPGSSVRGIFQAKILEWVAVPSSRGSFRPGDRTRVSCIAGRFFTIWVTREVVDVN